MRPETQCFLRARAKQQPASHTAAGATRETVRSRRPRRAPCIAADRRWAKRKRQCSMRPTPTRPSPCTPCLVARAPRTWPRGATRAARSTQRSHSHILKIAPPAGAARALVPHAHGRGTPCPLRCALAVPTLRPARPRSSVPSAHAMGTRLGRRSRAARYGCAAESGARGGGAPAKGVRKHGPSAGVRREASKRRRWVRAAATHVETQRRWKARAPRRRSRYLRGSGTGSRGPLSCPPRVVEGPRAVGLLASAVQLVQLRGAGRRSASPRGRSRPPPRRPHAPAADASSSSSAPASSRCTRQIIKGLHTVGAGVESAR